MYHLSIVIYHLSIYHLSIIHLSIYLSIIISTTFQRDPWANGEENKIILLNLLSLAIVINLSPVTSHTKNHV